MAQRPALPAEIAALLRLGWPLVLSQLALMALQATDVLMLGLLSPEALAAGALGAMVLHPLFAFGFGVVTAAAPMVAQALGARSARGVRRTMRQGVWLSLGLWLALTPFFLFCETILRALGQPEALAAEAASYLRLACFSLPFMLAVGALRALFAAHDATRVVLIASLVGVAVNIVADWALIFGKLGLPRLEVAGAGLATCVTHAAICLTLCWIVARRRPYRRYMIFARFWRADWPRFAQMLRLGLPIGLTLLAETTLFSAAAIFMGWIGTDALAAHAVALQITAFTFMVPLGLSQAATARVGLAVGRGDRGGAIRAGWAAMAASLAFMGGSATVFLLFPRALASLFLDPDLARNAAPLALAASYLRIAGLFQLVDGLQVAAAAALRGFSDTAIPALIAIGGYWIVGLPVGYWLAFEAGWAGIGLWTGLAAGLAVAALALTWRYHRMTRRIAARRAGA